ncbi:MAG: hypothetical protein P0Y55_08530 [Candidatus Cohnella colombiensis]|uniref:Uncharacterized protein n=1 Tax=Candidatus Cohnella colombiensis TaxID=3121368 RepID=A0AA95JC15_9BACL|nr:MAG: hypothetical protein P0Y55_08530 [Cohnella sp.]
MRHFSIEEVDSVRHIRPNKRIALGDYVALSRWDVVNTETSSERYVKSE